MKNHIEFIISLEGGYVNDPRDAGGETKYGISKRAYPSLDIKNLTKEQAIEIYKKDYYHHKLLEIDRGLSLVVFDSNVNHGKQTSYKLLQEVLNSALPNDLPRLVVDGIVGAKTLGACQLVKSTGKMEALILDSLLKRVLFYKDLVAKNNSQSVFLVGWINRIEKIRKEVLK